MPINLVQASFDQIRKIPGVVVQNITIQSCNNPTFAPDGSNRLADTAPYPQACDKQGPTQCATGTGGASKQSTAVKPSAAGGRAATNGTAGTGRAAAGSAGAASATGSATPGASDTAAGSSTTQQACNVDTGACVSGASGGSSGQAAAASPLTLAASSGWTSTQTLMALAIFFTLGLLLAPGVAVHLLRRRAK
jgi:phosphate transport system substrate-binding protein